MTEAEADKIAAIVVTADGGCSVCVPDLAAQLLRDFPEIEWRNRIAAAYIAAHANRSPLDVADLEPADPQLSNS